MRMAERETNFIRLPERKRRKINPFYKRPTANLHKVAKSPNKQNRISYVPKITPQGKGMVIGNTRTSIYTNSPPRKVRRRLNSPKNLSRNFKKIRMNSPPRWTLTKQLTPTSPLEKGIFNSYKKGGLVRKTGLARVHKGELVIPKSRVDLVRRAIRMYKRRKASK